MEPHDLQTDRRIAIVIGLGLFVIYALGACRTIYVGDSGELVTAAYVLGIPHPSGYPLYALLGKLWMLLLPIGSIAFRMSLFSAACAAAACALLFTTLRASGCSRVAALLGASLLAFSPSFWHEANIQRVYSLNALFVVLAINRAFAWYRDRSPRDLVLAMLVCGLGATNHTSMALVGIAVTIWAPLVEPGLFRKPKVVASCGAAFFAGLLVYAYLPIRARANPVLNWGEPTTLHDFLNVVLRRDFWPRAWWEGPADLVPILRDFLSSLGPESGWIGVSLALVALALGPWKERTLPLLVIAMNVAALARHGSVLDIFVWHRYYIPAYIMVIVMGASVLDRVTARVPKRLPAAVLLVPVVMLAAGWRDNDRSQYRIAQSFSEAILDALPPGARLFTTDDNIMFVLIYLHYVEKMRPDVQIILQGIDQRKSDFVFDPDEDPVYFTHHPGWSVEGLELVPRGLVYQAVRSGKPWPQPIPVPALEGDDDPRIPRDWLTCSLLAHYHFMQAVTWESRDWERAHQQLDIARAVARDHDIIHYNAGLVLARNGLFEEALDSFRIAERINPRGAPATNYNPATGPRRHRPDEMIRQIERDLRKVRVIEREIEKLIPPEIEPFSVEWEREMARQLALRKQAVAARGHLLRAGSPKDRDGFPNR